MNNDFYIFLDIDGVLNHIKWFKKVFVENLEKKGYHMFFCPVNIENLNRLLNFYKDNNFTPKIVITSTWRLAERDYDTCKKMLIKYGLDYHDEFDKTDLKPRGIRGRQIQNYLDKYNIKTKYVVIDDRSKYITTYFKKRHIILTSGIFGYGLTKSNVDNYINEFEQNKNY